MLFSPYFTFTIWVSFFPFLNHKGGSRTVDQIFMEFQMENYRAEKLSIIFGDLVVKLSKRKNARDFSGDTFMDE